MKNKYIKIINLSLIFVLGSCSYSFDKYGTQAVNDLTAGGGQKESTITDEKKLSYALINEQVLKPRCLNCHSGLNAPDLASYQDVVTHKADIYSSTIDTDRMPKGPRKLTAEQKQNLKKWLDIGAPEFAAVVDPNPAPNPEPAPTAGLPIERPVVWEQVKTKIFDQHCVSCHFAGNTDGISPYEDYTTVKNTIGTIYAFTAINPVMPPPSTELKEGEVNPNQLSSAEKDLISAWVNDGLLEKKP
jgi:uncharacterized membrane protein